ncbi:LppU/SCO3897 family protein [Micromonospora sp. CA-263727]|uniref:LppU/SCO3897 family protein n=1 Tax=Micromonospora sp. CA-263727 TaxID=3239967 RepID=UPI003D93AFA5
MLVLILGGATAFYLFGQDDEATTPVAAPTQEPEGPAADAPEDDGSPPSAPAANSSTDARFVQVGQCVRNTASAGGKPKLLINDCVPKSYEVLRRFDGKTSGEKDAEAKCAAVDGYTNWYFYDSELDSLDFVLCLKQRA